MSNDKEIKPSISIKYFFLTIITASVISIVGFLINNIFNSSPSKEIIVYQLESSNQMTEESYPQSQIDIKYKLKSDSTKQIRSFFKKSIIIKNNGNEGIENLNITFYVLDPELNLIDKPLITTIPSEIKKSLTIVNSQSDSVNRKDVWTIDLLNKGESIIFEYSAYSEKFVKSFDLTAIPRKKNWNVTFIKDIPLNENGESIDYTILYILFPILFIGIIGLLLALPLYYSEWNSNSTIREKYNNNFKQFYWNSKEPIRKLFSSFKKK